MLKLPYGTGRKGRYGMKLQAKWGMDYDMHEDKCYKIPVCPLCEAPFGKIYDDDEYHCFSCGKIIEVDDPRMKEWIAEREGTKTELEDCFPAKVKMKNGEVIKMGCGGKKCMEVHYRKNPVTLKWEQMGGKCKKCGKRYIV